MQVNTGQCKSIPVLTGPYLDGLAQRPACQPLGSPFHGMQLLFGKHTISHARSLQDVEALAKPTPWRGLAMPSLLWYVLLATIDTRNSAIRRSHISGFAVTRCKPRECSLQGYCCSKTQAVGQRWYAWPGSLRNCAEVTDKLIPLHAVTRKGCL